MIRRTTWSGTSFMTNPASAFEVAAAGPFSTIALASHCQDNVNDSNSAEAKICMSDIQGFFVSGQQPGMQVAYRTFREQSTCGAVV